MAIRSAGGAGPSGASSFKVTMGQVLTLTPLLTASEADMDRGARDH